MKRIAIIFLLATSAHAADWTKLRRGGQALGCALSFSDAFTTLRPGIVETNPLLGRGKPQAGRILATKGAICGLQIAYSEYRHHRYANEVFGPLHTKDAQREKMGFYMGGMQVALFGYATAHNLNIPNK